MNNNNILDIAKKSENSSKSFITFKNSLKYLKDIDERATPSYQLALQADKKGGKNNYLASSNIIEEEKSSMIESKSEFSNKKDLFRIAMSIPNVYVASISMGANMNQTLKAFKEAYEHNGPSLIIAYSPCISHGITGGLRNSLDEEKLLVESGYNILMRYNPIDNKLSIDSKEPNFSKYETVFENELRYKNLKKANPKAYEELYTLNIDSAKERYEYYKKLSE